MLMDQNTDWKSLIKDYNNFPKDGVVFRDINPLFRNSAALQQISKEFLNPQELSRIDLIAGIEARGFTVASLLAGNFKKGIILVRKVGKLPGKTKKKKYGIEYGNATIEIQDDAIKNCHTSLSADDLIATGATGRAPTHSKEGKGSKRAYLSS